jgi:hypothetical protein
VRWLRLLLAKLMGIVADVLILLARIAHALTLWLMPNDIRKEFENVKRNV